MEIVLWYRPVRAWRPVRLGLTAIWRTVLKPQVERPVLQPHQHTVATWQPDAGSLRIALVRVATSELQDRSSASGQSGVQSSNRLPGLVDVTAHLIARARGLLGCDFRGATGSRRGRYGLTRST